MSPSVIKLLDLIETGAVTAQNASEAIRQAGGTSLCLLEAVRALGAGDGGGGSVSLTPGIAYVEANGDDETGTLGDPGRPFATGTSAWAAGQAGEQPFAIQFGVGEFWIETSGQGSGWLRCLAGRGYRESYIDSPTKVHLASGSPSVVNTDGGHGANCDLSISNLALAVTTGGSGVKATDGGYYQCGNGGSVTIMGCGLIAVDAGGGGDDMSTDGGTYGGESGHVTLMGALKLGLGDNLLIYGGTGTSSVGSHGTLTADGCDLRGYVLAGTITLGRCSYTSGLSINNDRGGNSAYP